MLGRGWGLPVTGELTKALQCVICHKEYPPGTVGVCPDDGARVEVDPLVGTIFAEKYEILSRLGEGGMSRVYKARHTFMKRIVAVKLLHDCAGDPVGRARFEQEAEAASALSHPNVVTVYDFGLTASGQPFFIMDCLEGKSLADILSEDRCLSIEQAFEIFYQACDGLEHAHQKGIIHRDVKPSNLIILKQKDGSSLVKLVDFGIAKITTPPPSTSIRRNRITGTGEVFGTPAYMSPEQCNCLTLDARSDMYSFGCVMYEALAGEPPLFGDTIVATVVKHVNEQPAPLHQKALVVVPPSLEAVIMKCLEKNPQDRYNSLFDLKQALLEAAVLSGVKGLRLSFSGSGSDNSQAYDPETAGAGALNKQNKNAQMQPEQTAVQADLLEADKARQRVNQLRSIPWLALSILTVLSVLAGIYALQYLQEHILMAGLNDSSISTVLRLKEERKAPAEFFIYSDIAANIIFTPTGYIGDRDSIIMDPTCTHTPCSPPTCLHVTYQKPAEESLGFAGVHWLNPAANWGQDSRLKFAGMDVSNSGRVTFHARADRDCLVHFQVGGVRAPYGDSLAEGARIQLHLDSTWRPYTIALPADKSKLNHIISAFMWRASIKDNPDGVSFYLDDIKYEPR